MGCNQYKERLTPYLDNELSREEVQAVERHLQGCQSCTAETQAQWRLKRELRSAGKRYTPALEFRRRVEAQIAPPQKSKWFAGWIPRLVFASLLVAFAVLSWNQLRLREADRTMAELVDVHVATLASASPVDVLSTDRHTVKPWFQGKIPFTFNLPELNDSGFTLVGGRVSYLDQQPAAQLLYEVRKHKMSVFIQPGRPEWRENLSSGSFSAFTIRNWKNDGLHYFLITDASSPDAEALVRLFKNAQ